ncbi:nucleoside recognition protein [Terasakiella sp. A23]|uniref:nucleoside recognition protein n=1 Tax=Terasakiella sp. FCG-A23 TaxID=3080561 RepID=UPI0029532BD8|nr:nucleoside recognition protein [Terasakiella sp. A23]MDV7338542.1 nucleoside recognition protein [Terasakiella sp. A23]
MNAIIHWLKKPVTDSVKLYWELLKVMVPIMIVVRLGVEFGMIEHVARLFTPFMDLVGLPAEAGIIWTTAMLVNIYAGMVTLIALLPEAPMSVAQITVLGSMILIAHSLPIEQRIVQKAGPSFIATTLLRVVGALVYGAILNAIYQAFNFLQDNATISWLPQTEVDAGWAQWSIDSAIQLFSIFWIILVLVVLLKILEILKVTDFISKLLSPVLGLMGISEKAIPVTMIGVMLGLGYGGALIIREAKEGNMSGRDIFLSLSFMSLFHSMIEDTLLIFALGADLTGILIGRFIFSFIVVILLSQLITRMPEQTFNRLLFRKT